jgi:magnesium transporter
VHLLDNETRNKVLAILEKQEQCVENLATKKIIKCHKDDFVGETQNSYAKLAKHKDVAMYLYIVGDDEHLVGVIDIKELLEGKEMATLGDIMIKNMEVLQSKNTYKEAAEIFARYDFRAIPIVDEYKKLLGAVTYKDLMKFKRKFTD